MITERWHILPGLKPDDPVWINGHRYAPSESVRSQIRKAVEDARQRFVLAEQGLIDGLRRENERLRTALRFYVDNIDDGTQASIALGQEDAL